MNTAVVVLCILLCFALERGGYAQTPARQSTAPEAMENHDKSNSSIQTMEAKYPPSATCTVDEATVVPGQAVHVRVHTLNVPQSAEMMWSVNAGSVQSRGKEAVIDTSGLGVGQHEAKAELFFEGRTVSCHVVFTIASSPLPPSQPNYQQVKIFYATDRKPIKIGDHAQYSSDQDARETMSYGYAVVSIPRDHRMGEMERPSMWKLELREDPDKHVVVLNSVSEDRKTFLYEIRDRLKPNLEVLIFVHGYDTMFDDAERRLGQITYDLGFGGVAILYSWPSKGSPIRYAADEESVEWSTPHFKNFLQLVVEKTGATAVHIIAHSMGNRALAGALKNISDEHRTLKPRLQEIVLAAPDINVGIFKQLAAALPKTANHFTIYEASSDRALYASHKYHQFIRVGDSDPHMNIFEGYDVLDATNVDTGFLGHSYFGESKSVLADIFQLIRGKASPEDRFGLRRQAYASQTYWTFLK